MSLINEEDLSISAEQIAKDGLTALDKKYQKSVGFFAWNYFVATGKIIYKVWEKVLYIVNCLIDLSNMEYDDLVKFCYNTRGIEAKTETASSGYLQVTNGAGTITAGDIFETASGLQFKALTTKTLVTNDLFEVECLKKGSIGNVAAYSIVVIPTTIQGIVSVSNPEEFTNGYDNETKEALLERYYIDLRTPAACGNKYHYKKWALDIPGVGKVKVKPLWNGNNTVKVVILDSNFEIASPELVEEVQNYIDPYTVDDEGNKVGWGCGDGEAPIGAYCTVTTAESLKLNFSIKIKKNESYSNSTIQSNVEKAIDEYLDSQKFKELPSGTDFYYLSYSKLASKITLAEGVEDMDIDTFKINNLQDNIIVYDNNDKTQVAEIGTVAITLID